MNEKKVLISGASFAGLSSAFWMSELGYEVTVVESRGSLHTGGTAVNIGGATIDIVKRMGLFEPIRANRLSLMRWDIKDADDRVVRRLEVRKEGEPPPEHEFEIERDVLLNMLFDLVKNRCEIVFGDSITSITDSVDQVDVTFKKGTPRSFDLVLGCDGVHSNVRTLVFGDEAQFTRFLEQYFCITIVNRLLIPANTAQMFNVPGKAVMLNATPRTTDIILGFVSEKEIPYDRRDEAQQRKIIRDTFTDIGWKSEELLAAIDASSSFYFDKLAQIRMPSWSKGRVVLVGDAGYCPSPAAGMGGSLAIDGASALADAMREFPDDFTRAFQHYETTLRPFIEEVQARAVKTGVETLVPRTAEAIAARNAKTDHEF